MNWGAVQRILGLLLMLFSTSMLPPLAVSWYYQDGAWHAFATAFALLFTLGAVVWAVQRHNKRELRFRDGFLVVTLFWIVLGAAGAVPLLAATNPAMTVTDAFFESFSGFTTTGATVLTGLEYLPRSILYYRQQIQWLGGIGIVVLAVALLPMLGIGGMQLYRAETPGPSKESNKITPRITQTAKALWIIYLVLTATCAAAYWLAGMSVFDAVAHSFSTVSTAGFSTYDASLGHFNSRVVEAVAVVFMFIGGVNFSLHFFAWRRLRLQSYLLDPEFRAFLSTLLALVLLTWLYLLATGHYSSVTEAFVDSLFHAVSAHTTTGFVTENFSAWPGVLPVMLIFAAFIGGCANSTAGGMKVVRWLLVYKQGAREVKRLVHPSAEIPVRIGGKPVSLRVMDAVWGFFAVYVVIFTLMMVLLITTGLDEVSAFSAVAATINNLGPGLGEVSASFATLTPVAKWLCIITMLLGRLEIFTLLVLVTPDFWRS